MGRTLRTQSELLALLPAVCPTDIIYMSWLMNSLLASNPSQSTHQRMLNSVEQDIFPIGAMVYIALGAHWGAKSDASDWNLAITCALSSLGVQWLTLLHAIRGEFFFVNRHNLVFLGPVVDGSPRPRASVSVSMPFSVAQLCAIRPVISSRILPTFLTFYSELVVFSRIWN